MHGISCLIINRQWWSQWVDWVDVVYIYTSMSTLISVL